MLWELQYGHIGPAAESLQVIVRIPIIITVACRDYTVSPGEQDVIQGVASSKCWRASRRWTQIRIKTWPPRPRPPPNSEGFPCYHGEKGEARAFHCLVPSSGVSGTPSQRSDVMVGAAGRGHQSAACHPVTSTNTGTNWDGGRRRKRGLHLIHWLNGPAGPTPQIRTRWRTCLFLMPQAAGGQQRCAAWGVSTVHVSVSPPCGEVRHLENVQPQLHFIYKQQISIE